MAENNQPLRREIDDVTRIWEARYGALQKKLKEYDDAMKEKDRLATLASDLEKQTEQVKEQIKAQNRTIQAIEHDIRPQLEVFKSGTGYGEEAASSTLPTGSEANTVTPKRRRKAAAQGEENLPERDRPLLTAVLSDEPLSTTPTLRITEQAAQQVIADVEKVHGHKLTSGQIEAILVNYPHGCFKEVEFYFPKCKECGANAGMNKQGSGTHFIQGDMGMVCHMRRHGYLSGLNAKNIDRYCTMGERASGTDLLRISEGRQPLRPEIMTLGQPKKQTSNRKSQSMEQVTASENGSNTKSKQGDAILTSNKPLSNGLQFDSADRNDLGGDIMQKRTRAYSTRVRKSNSFYTAHGFVPTNEVDFDDEDVPNDTEYAPKKEANHDDE